jgi:PadR family transcriptional regulator PadR
VDQQVPLTNPSAEYLGRFALSPPRHFVLPALLLLLSEEPGYGYQLVKGLSAFRFGTIDRPTVYRGLAQLEKDGLVESWSAESKAGTARRVYGLTVDGQRALRIWMGVMKEERDGLDRVLRRYRATGTTDAVLATAEAGVVPFATPEPAPEPEPPPGRGALIDGNGQRAPDLAHATSRDGADTSATDARAAGTRRDQVRRYELLAERSALLIEARSSVGPITFGAIGLRGWVEARICDGVVSSEPTTRAHLEVPVAELRSGNRLYDAELLRRVDARRFPVVTLDLDECVRVGLTDRYSLVGRIGFHDVTRTIRGGVSVTTPSAGVLRVSGEQAFDIRDYGIASPTVLMLRIYPAVSVRLQVEAELARRRADTSSTNGEGPNAQGKVRS